MSNKTTTNQELSKNEYLIALINDLNDQGILSQKWEERTKVKQNFKQYENILQKVESEQESILNLITKNDNYKNLTYKKALQKLWDYHLSGILFEYVRSLDETTRKKKMDGFKNAFVGKKEENK